MKQPRRTRQELAQAEVARWAGKVSTLTDRVADLKASLAKAESDLQAANAEYEHAKTAPALRDTPDDAEQMSIEDVDDESDLPATGTQA